MAYVQKLFDKNFLEYASYVVKDRAIPHLDDGLKPVQRRIIHSLIEKDDGKFHKVANIIGHTMQYHPHGDSSIGGALVTLANKDLLIDKQGNFGNNFTGDPASAARYIECRLTPFAKEIFYNPELTQYEDSYDGRRKEPITFPCKIPLAIIQGVEGIAVGMSTKILPHNLLEVLEAEKKCLRGEDFQLFPDFPTGGLIDVTNYDDGLGKVLVRAKLDVSDPKKITITEIPFGSTTESLMDSIENAAKKNKIKIGAINDFTTDEVEIEIKLPRGVHSNDVVDALYAFTDCEMSISVNLLLINEARPVIMNLTQVVQYHANKLVSILRAELENEKRNLQDKLHARTLEQIFIEERIYKLIEEQKSRVGVITAVQEGFIPFMSKIKREITEDDIERLLKIPIRRISLYDINKVKKEMKEIKDRIKEINFHLDNIVDYAVSFIDSILSKKENDFERQSKIVSFNKTDVREAAVRNLKLRYDSDSGYLGFGVTTGNIIADVSEYDRVLIIKKDTHYFVTNVQEKNFIGKGILYVGLADTETMEKVIFNILYKNEQNCVYLKRCRIEKFILEKEYDHLIPEGCSFLKLSIKEDISVSVDFKQKKLLRIAEDLYEVDSYLVKGVKAKGVRLSPKEFSSAKFIKSKRS
ncbi:DNA topoisomerase IV subunit A [Thiospirochaeta perfilievii]|uniref:DNA topoisomerase IV subunit A n=1 Tax=Thiospirochaeta perfilievii TaxID=252967 RepID=A0A5C1QBW7_9SPIO|nr:DNA topoisomerase IV subunit A [Thiospirochaeta perfilievii]QEN05575.1 DNA topoisomerase IV subunit A [Thiospirochaeta perfilievii]